MRPAVPQTHALARVAQARIAVSGFAFLYLLFRLPHFWGVAALPAHRWAGVGLLAPWSAPWPVAVYIAVLLASLVLALACAVGWRYRWTAPAFALCLGVTLTYRNSWGMIFHTENLLMLHAGILALAPADRRYTRWARVTRPGDERWARGILWTLSVCTLLTYAVAGWAKIDRVGWHWFEGTTIRQQVAFDNLRKQALGSFYSPLGLWAAKIGALWGPLAGLTLIVELFAPLALLDRRALLGWAALSWLFHLGVVVTMGIVFPYPLAWVAYCGFLPLGSRTRVWVSLRDRFFRAGRGPQAPKD